MSRAGRWFLAALLATSIGCQANAGPNVVRGSDKFQRGRALVCQGAYAEAIPVLEQYLAESPRGKHASRARFFIAKAHLGQLHFDAARKAFQQTVQDYPGSLEAHKSRYKLAQLDFLQGRVVEALGAFEKAAHTPNGPLAPEAAAFADYLRRRNLPAEQPPLDEE